MSKIDFGFSAIIGVVLAVCFGTGWFCGLAYADHYAVAGLGKGESVNTPSAAIIAHHMFRHHEGANAIGAAAARHGQYNLSGIFDLAHHAW